jgi:quercetin dioxygenase-like cupin family protein
MKSTKQSITTLVKTSEFEQLISCIPGGTEFPAHSVFHDTTFFCLKGRAKILLNDKIILLEPGVFHYLPSHTSHALVVEEDLMILSSLFLFKHHQAQST